MDVVISEFQSKRSGRYNAAGKSRLDVLEIARRRGYHHVKLATFDGGYLAFRKLGQLVRVVLAAGLRAGAGDTVLAQYPYGRKFDAAYLAGLSCAARLRGARLVVLVHDINCLRPDEDFEGSAGLGEVVRVLSCADLVICHSDAMKRLLEERGLTATAEVLGPFDYLCDLPAAPRAWSADPVVDVAGNLLPNKSGYAYGLGKVPGAAFELYGAGYDADLAEGGRGEVRYMGACAPDELPGKLAGQYGLVWDGPSIATCEGPFGEYLRYNSPHKFSLYVAAGLPVIVWSESALAGFVREHGVGIAVDTLEDLGERLRAIGRDEYDAMTARVREMAADVAAGNRLGRFL